MKNVYKLSLVAVAASLVLVNCSGGGEDEDIYVPTTLTGQFVDTYVKGLNYTCTGMVDGVVNQLTDSGVTNEKGEFTCTDEGELIEFSLGSYVIGSYQHSGYPNDTTPIVTPYSFNLSSEGAINLAQLLQTLDDKTTEGALTIPANFTALNDVTIKLDDPDFDALMADALNIVELVSENVAKAHLDETLVSLGLMETTDTTALESFVLGKNITFSAGEESMTSTFSSEGYYEENSDTHFCSGLWVVSSSTTIHTTCTDEGVTPTESDESIFEFIGDLQSGMTVIHSDAGEVTITNIETAVNPDA